MIDAYHLYLNSSEVLARRQCGWGPWRRQEELLRWQWNATAPSSLNLDALALRRRRHATLSVHVGSALAKFMVLELPAGLEDGLEEHAAAQAQMQHQLGLNPAQWELRLDHLPARGKVVACALRADVAARLRQLARERNMRLVSLRPFAATAWNALQLQREKQSRAPDSAGALMLVEKDAFTIVIEKDGAIDAMNALAHRREADLINREVRRLAYALGDQAQQHIRLAIAADLMPLASLHREKVVLRDDYLQQRQYMDFRDLLFLPPLEVAP